MDRSGRLPLQLNIDTSFLYGSQSLYTNQDKPESGLPINCQGFLQYADPGRIVNATSFSCPTKNPVALSTSVSDNSANDNSANDNSANDISDLETSSASPEKCERAKDGDNVCELQGNIKNKANIHISEFSLICKNLNFWKSN